MATACTNIALGICKRAHGHVLRGVAFDTHALGRSISLPAVPSKLYSFTGTSDPTAATPLRLIMDSFDPNSYPNLQYCPNSEASHSRSSFALTCISEPDEKYLRPTKSFKRVVKGYWFWQFG